MKYVLLCLAIAAASACGGSTADGQAVRFVSEKPLKGKLAAAKELSGAALWGSFLIVCTDEGAELNVLDAATLKLVGKPSLLKDDDDEIDMEGAASDGRFVYIVGSHSMRREEDDDDDRPKKRRQSQVEPHEDSYSLFRLVLDERGEVASSERISLRDLLRNDKTLGPYTKIPGKENGVDIEGIAVKDGWLFVGFRGPVLPGNRVPVLCFEFDQPQNYLVKLLELDGSGIRDMLAVQDGFLILTGPPGEEDGAYTLYHWSGGIPSQSDAVDGRLTTVGDVPTDGKSKPEGLALLAETDDEWRLLLLSDGSEDARELAVAKP